jgi:hypothetical protein
MEAQLRQYKDFQVAILESLWVVEVVTFVGNCFFNLGNYHSFPNKSFFSFVCDEK